MSTAIGRSYDVAVRPIFSWSKFGIRLRPSSGSLFWSVILMILLQLAPVGAAGAMSTSEFVVPSGPVISLKDGQEFDGHIIGIDEDNVVILAEDGSEQTMPRASINLIKFKTIAGLEIIGSLNQWKPGVYELSADETIVTIYSTMPRRPKPAPEPEKIVEVAVEEPVEDISGSDDIANGTGGPAAAITEELATGETGEQLAKLTPGEPIEIEVSAQNAVENSTPVAFNIQLSRASEASVVLIYATIDGSAIGGEDYESARGVLVIEAGETEARIETSVINDDISEDMEELRLFLTVDPSIAVVKSRQIVATIEDDDR